MDTERSLPGRGHSGQLVNDLDALAGSTVIALDDYHVIDTPEVHDVVAFLPDQGSPGLACGPCARYRCGSFCRSDGRAQDERETRVGPRTRLALVATSIERASAGQSVTSLRDRHRHLPPTCGG
jgi:hypothetical protein